MSTLEQLQTLPTKAQILANLYDALQTAGFPITSWRAGGEARTFTEAIGQSHFDFVSPLASVIVDWFFLETSTGDALTFLARSNYEVTRRAATFEKRWIRFDDDGSVGPKQFAIGAHHLTTVAGLTFTNITGGVLPLDDSLFVLFQSDSPGEEYAGSITADVTWNTPIGGVTFDPQPIIAAELAAQESTGAAIETDESLRTRCRDQWAQLGMGSVEAAYEKRVLEADASVTRVAILENTPTPGEVKVYIAGTGGASSGPVVAAVQAYLEDDTRRPLCTTVDVDPATEVEIDITATVNVLAAQSDDYEDAVNSAILAFLNAFAISKGDADLDLVEPTKLENMLHDVLDETSVRRIVMSVPSAPITLAAGEIPIPGTVSITVVPV